MSISERLSVKVWISSDVCEKGFLTFNQDDVIIELESGSKISGRNSGDILFEVEHTISYDNNGERFAEPIEKRFKIHLKPLLMTLHPYFNQGGQFIEDIFPPSTGGFYGRLQSGKNEAIYIVQKVENSERFWLMIVDPSVYEIYETQLIYSYEAEALSLIDDMKIRQILYGKSSRERERTREEILRVLETPAPSWQELSRIIGDVSIPNLKLGKTMRETFDQIVPISFPDEIRKELMAFLAYVVKSKIPVEDPLEHSFRYSSMTVLEELLNGHLMHLVDRTEWPPYVKLMVLAARGQLESPKKAYSELIVNAPWLLYIQKCAELLPSWLNFAVSSAKSLNESGRIALGLPTTKSAAKRSKLSWKTRFAEITHGLRVVGLIDSNALGLVELLYLGVAYRWSHRHMKFITRLGGIGENPPHLQVMLVPFPAAERIKRALPSVLNVAWSTRTSNLDLFDSKSNRWIVPINRIIESVERRSSIKKLINQYDDKEIPETYVISKEEAIVADLVSEGVESVFLEIPEFLNNWGLGKRKIHSILSKLINRKIMKLTYEISDTRLISLAIIIQGKDETVSSLASELLKSTPTSYARLDETGENAVILSRLPEESVYDLASQLTARGIEHDVNIRCMRPTTFRRYTSNLYQRLLKEDGTWDDDVSAFLSQARSKRKELSKSNA